MTAITASHDVVSDILCVARRDAALSAEGAVIFLKKVPPTVCNVDSSSGTLGSATYSALASVELHFRSLYQSRSAPRPATARRDRGYAMRSV